MALPLYLSTVSWRLVGKLYIFCNLVLHVVEWSGSGFIQDKDDPVITEYNTGLASQLMWMWRQIEKLISLSETLLRYPSPFTNLAPFTLHRIYSQMFWNVLPTNKKVKDYFYHASVHKKHKMNTQWMIVSIQPCIYPSIIDLHNFLISTKFGMSGCLH
jgi:hypothetical protein